MPINQILPDGRVRIVNSKTGQTKDVAPEELGSYNPRLVTDYQEALQRKQSIENAAKAVSGGQLKITDIPTEQRTDVATSLSEMGYVPPEAAAEKKKSDSTKEILNFINNLEKQYSEAGGGTFGVGPGARIKGAIESGKGKLGLNEAANVYGDTSQGFAATLKSLTGDTGVLTDQDFERLAKLLPSLGSTKGESEQKFNLLRDQIAAKFGGDKTQTSFQPKSENTYNPVSNLIDAIPGFGALAGYTDRGSKGELSQQQRPMNPLEAILTGAGGGGPLGYAVSRPDIFKETFFPALEVAGGLQLAGAVKNKLGGGVSSFNKSAVSEARKQAAGAVDKKISTEAFLKTGDKYVTQDPTANKLWRDVLRPALENKKEMSVTELLDQVKVWNDAYTSAGKVGKTALAGINDALARSAKQVIKEEAPEVSKYTAQLAKLYQIDNMVSKFAPAAIGAAGATGGAYILGKLLGKKNP